MWKKQLKTEDAVSSKVINDIEDVFINNIFKSGHNATVYLVSGIKLHGTVCEFDNSSVMLKKIERNQETLCLIFKHAIATIIISENKISE